MEAAVYERTQSCEGGRPGPERWDLNIRQFKLDEEGKLLVRSRYSTGDVWEDAEKATANGKSRFAVELCTYRDGKVYDKEGKEVATRKPITDESFKDADLAMAWGSDQGDRQGRRLLIRRDDRAARYLNDPEPLSPSAADLYPAYGDPNNERSPSDLVIPNNQPSPSDKVAPALAPQRTQLREWTATVDRCGRTCLCASDSFHLVANDNGRLVTVDSAGENAKPLDLKRHGITHLRMHEGKFFSADTGAEVKINYRIDPAQLEGRPFFEFRGVGRDSTHYFITEGLPADQTISQQQVVRSESLRGADGVFRQERVYSLEQRVVAADSAVKQYKLSEDGMKLAGFEAVKDGETHPEHGILRFVFKPEGKEQIRVYQKRGYESDSWTFLQRDDQVKNVLDCNGCHYKTATTNWVKTEQMKVKEEVMPYDEYNPPALDPARRRPSLNYDATPEPEIDFNAGDPFSQSSGTRLKRAERTQVAALTLPLGMPRTKSA